MNLNKEVGPKFWLYVWRAGVLIGASLLITGVITLFDSNNTGANIGSPIIILAGIGMLGISIDSINTSNRKKRKKRG